MALNQRYLNPQLGRVIQDAWLRRDWAHGRGSVLIDREGNEYLDLLSGYGVFALGRSHPYVKEQLGRVLAADPPSLPQLGVTTLAGGASRAASWGWRPSPWTPRSCAAREPRRSRVR